MREEVSLELEAFADGRAEEMRMEIEGIKKKQNLNISLHYSWRGPLEKAFPKKNNV